MLKKSLTHLAKYSKIKIPSQHFARTFCSESNPEAQVPTEAAEPQLPSTETQEPPIPQFLMSGRDYINLLRENTYVDYKEMPNHIGHWNKDSPDYVSSPREEDGLQRHVDGYNDIIRQFKSD